MAIILIFFKLAYAFFSFRFGRERAGGLPTFGNWSNSGANQYQNPENLPNSTYQAQ